MNRVERHRRAGGDQHLSLATRHRSVEPSTGARPVAAGDADEVRVSHWHEFEQREVLVLLGRIVLMRQTGSGCGRRCCCRRRCRVIVSCVIVSRVSRDGCRRHRAEILMRCEHCGRLIHEPRQHAVPQREQLVSRERRTSFVRHPAEPPFVGDRRHLITGQMLGLMRGQELEVRVHEHFDLLMSQRVSLRTRQAANRNLMHIEVLNLQVGERRPSRFRDAIEPPSIGDRRHLIASERHDLRRTKPMKIAVAQSRDLRRPELMNLSVGQSIQSDVGHCERSHLRPAEDCTSRRRHPLEPPAIWDRRQLSCRQVRDLLGSQRPEVRVLHEHDLRRCELPDLRRVQAVQTNLVDRKLLDLRGRQRGANRRGDALEPPIVGDARQLGRGEVRDLRRRQREEVVVSDLLHLSRRQRIDLSRRQSIDADAGDVERLHLRGCQRGTSRGRHACEPPIIRNARELRGSQQRRLRRT